MAAVTVGTPAPSRHIFGDCAVRFFVVSGASGSTLITGLQNILFVTNQSCNQAGVATIITTIVNASGTLTISTTGAAMVNEVIMVIGREG